MLLCSARPQNPPRKPHKIYPAHQTRSARPLLYEGLPRNRYLLTYPSSNFINAPDRYLPASRFASVRSPRSASVPTAMLQKAAS